MTGNILAVMFALLTLLGPAIKDPIFYGFILFGGLTILPCYNILSKYHLGESVFVNYFQNLFLKDQSSGAPFK